MKGHGHLTQALQQTRTLNPEPFKTQPHNTVVWPDFIADAMLCKLMGALVLAGGSGDFGFRACGHTGGCRQIVRVPIKNFIGLLVVSHDTFSQDGPKTLLP